MPAQPRQTTVVSTKGQMILPKAVRERLGWGPGTRLTVEEAGGRVTLKPESPFESTTFEEIAGCLDYDGPVRSVEDMHSGVRAEAKRRWLAND